MVSACLDDNDVALLVDGALPAAERDRVERHLDDCATCTELVAELARALAPDRAAPVGYRLVRVLGDSTWEADDPHGRRVELTFGATCDPRLVALRHPNVVEVFEVGELEGEPFVASALAGETLREWCAAATASPAQLIAIWRDALDGLAALHHAGLVHGRVSPDHVFRDENEQIRIGGFTRRLPRASGYVAPEVLAGSPASVHSDQFAACAALWEALAGAKPFTGSTPGALAVAMQLAPRVPHRGNRRIYAALLRGLSVEPERRWRTPDALRAALASRQGLGAPAVIAVVLAVAAAIALALR